MGFLTGRLTCLRFRVLGTPPPLFGPDQLTQLADHAIGSQKKVTAEGVEIGWTTGETILDTDFDLLKNVYDDALHFALRVDVQKLPGDLFRAYAQTELKALAAENPSGRPSARQRKEARELAKARLEQEAHDGRYLRRKAYPVLWDRQTNELLVSTTAAGVLRHLEHLFHETFGLTIEPYTAGRQAQRWESEENAGALAKVQPSAFVADATHDVAWLAGAEHPDYLGNEFLLWLWFMLDGETDTIPLADKSAASLLLTRTLQLECPRGQSGRESISSDTPVRLPEARQAVRAGKLPRQAGMLLVRQDQTYELTLQAETFLIRGAKLPASEESEERVRLEERVNQIRHLRQTLDLLFDAFGKKRIGGEWPRELERMRGWLQRERKDRLAAAG
jgi:hypothetical protein